MTLLLEKKLPFGFFLVHSQRPPFDFKEVEQVHGSEIAVVVDKNHYTASMKADGLMEPLSNEMSILAIKTADCLPVAILGQKGVALIHAGWQGVKKEILLQKKVECIAPHYFFLGPHIRECCYEVQKEFKENFPLSCNFLEKNGRIYFSLEKEITHQIKKNYPTAKIESSSICTCCDKDFHSYRRDKTNKRNWNILLS